MKPTLRRSLVAGLALLAIVVVASCGTISAFVDLTQALQNNGYTKVRVNIDQNAGGSGLLIVADSPGGESGEASARKAAGIAWKTFPRQFDTVRVKVDGDTSQLYDRSTLVDAFGPRDAGLDKKSLQDDTKNIGLGVLIGLAGMGVLVVVIIVIILLLVRRSNRKKQAAAAAAYGQQSWGGGSPPHGGYPPQGGYPAQGGYPPPGTYPPQGVYPPPGQAPMPPQPQAPPPGDPNQTPPGWG